MAEELRFRPWVGSPGVVASVVIADPGPVSAVLSASAQVASFAGAGTVAAAAGVNAVLAAQAQAASFSGVGTVAGGLGVNAVLAAAAQASSFSGAGTVALTGDLRQIGLAGALLAYWESRPAYCSDAPASLTLAPTLSARGSAPPVVTLAGPLSPPRQLHISYPTIGALGVGTFRINEGDGVTNGHSGTIGTAVDIGGGNTLTWSGPTTNLDNRHYAVVAGWDEVPLIFGNTPRSAFKWTDNLTPNVGPIYEAVGQSSKNPALLSAQPLDTPAAMLENTSGVPGLATGTDTPIKVAIVAELVFIPTGNVSPRLFSFNGVGAGDTTTKNALGMAFGGNTFAGANNQYYIEHHDNAGTSKNVFSLAANKDDVAPHVFIADYINGQIYVDGQSVCTLASIATGVTTALGRCTLFGRKLGTAAPTAADFIRARISAVAMGTWTTPQNLLVAQTLAGVGM